LKSNESYNFLSHKLQASCMPPGSPQTDARREQLRQQAIARRQAVVDRIVTTRAFVVGGVVAITCVLAAYLDANARAHTSSTSGSTAIGSGYAGAGYQGDGGGSGSLGVFGGGAPPSSSSGSGTVVSGGS
jgi:hypothetical protein